MSDYRVEITETSEYTISIDTSLVQNENNVEVQLTSPTNIDIVGNNVTIFTSDISDFNSAVSGLIPVKNISAGSGIGISSVSGDFTVSVTGSFGLTSEEVDDRVSNLLVAGNYVNLNYNDLGNSLIISVTGVQPSGNYSLVGHSHNTSDITDFNSGVSGLLPSVSGSGYIVSSFANNVYTLSASGLQPSGNYSVVGHSHVIADVSGLQNALDSKQPSGVYASGIHYHVSSDITDFNSAVSGLIPPSNFTSLTGLSGIVVTNSGTNYFVTLSDPTIQLTDITDLSSNARTFLLTPSSSNLNTLISDETGSGNLVFNNSPAFSGTPTVPTAPSGTNSTQIASTSFVRTEISNLVDSSPSTLDTLNELAAALGDDPNFATTIASGLGQKANLSGAIFTGPVTIPSGTGNFDSLTVNNIVVSISGHSHNSNDIVDFGSSVSGLLPTIINSGNNRILTSTGSSVGINAENNATFDGTTLAVSGVLIVDKVKIDNNVIYAETPTNNKHYLGINVDQLLIDTSEYFSAAGSGGVTIFGTNNPTLIITNETAEDYPTEIKLRSAGGSSNKLIIGSYNTENYNGNGPSTNVNEIYSLADYDLSILAESGSLNLNAFNNSVNIGPILNIDNLRLDSNTISSTNTNGNIIISPTGTGRVGIKHNNPNYTLDVNGSGNFSSGLYVNNIAVSISGHTHSSLDITNFNSSVSGLLPTVANSGNNRLLTSDGTSTGINAESLITASGAIIEVGTTGVFLAGMTIPSIQLYSAVNESAAIIFKDSSGVDKLNIIRDDEDDENKIMSLFSPLLINATDQSVSINSSGLLYNGTQVSVSGHTHTSANITDFNSAVSGLIPVKDILSGSGIGVAASSGNYTISVSGNYVASTGTLDVLGFNTNIEPNLLQGQLGWNNTEGTINIALTNDTDIHVGEHSFYRVRNETGSPLYKGQAVYASGVHANGIITPSLYTADGSIREIRFIGLMLENLNNNNNGYAIQFGHIENIDTRGNVASNISVGDETWADGDILYVHPTVAGKLTKVEPKHSIAAAIILDAANNGRIFVRPTSYGHLDDNHDVAISGATNGQFLQYNSVTNYWVPSSSGNFSTLLVNGTGVSVSGHTHTSSNITDFNSSVSGLLPTISNSGDNRILTSDGTSTGINAESNLTFDGNLLSVSSGLSVISPSGFISANFEPVLSPNFGQSATLRLVESNRGFGPTISINYHGDSGAETDSEGVRHRATPRIALIKSSGTYESPTVLGGWEALSVIRTEAVGQSGLDLVGRMVTWADGAVGGSNIYQPSRMNIEVSSGSGNLDRNISIFSNGSVTTNCSLSVDQGLSAPTPIFSLGTVSGNVSINYGIDKQIQTLTLNGTATNFIEGSGWDISNKSIDVLLEIIVNSTTTVVWTIIDDQYNPFPFFTPGKYLVLLRSMGTTIQGHYIGVKTN
jgi:hypothetical protein